MHCCMEQEHRIEHRSGLLSTTAALTCLWHLLLPACNHCYLQQLAACCSNRAALAVLPLPPHSNSWTSWTATWPTR
jgi:hypothetical protein